AERVRREQHVPAVAIFWVDAEDHDWDEVKSCAVLDEAEQVIAIALDDPAGANARPVGRLGLDDSALRAVDALGAALPQTAHTADLLARLREAYAAGRGMSEAFARWIEALLGSKGLVVFDSSDAAAKPLLAELFAA